jgi:hypothetical protein
MIGPYASYLIGKYKQEEALKDAERYRRLEEGRAQEPGDGVLAWALAAGMLAAALITIVF